eukprot:CAMPEP_0171767372 /NCGR_PEP_ID=MMETSP0991-20121206/51790_1 /TAXON_ID=483369 /ORGANISM="non described non described, Strain CCMP2098" /LENGTH=262 /DNA_ID=CAMNT_0012372169 /DNA_START=37 /DNA_END=825 /DNA_ORIENTATION=-
MRHVSSVIVRARHRCLSTTPQKKVVDNSGGMDVSAWSWKWRAAGGAAIVIFTPWSGLKLLQINWEVREKVESVLPSFIEWVRETYGFEDEDKDRRRHIAYMDELYSESHRFVVCDPNAPNEEICSGAVPGTACVSQVAILCPGVSESTIRHPTAMSIADAEPPTTADVLAETVIDENDNHNSGKFPLVSVLNEVGSLWHVEIERSGLEGLLQDVVRVRPCTPGQKTWQKPVQLQDREIPSQAHSDINADKSWFSRGLIGRVI